MLRHKNERKVGKKTSKKEMDIDNPLFLLRHKADFLWNFVQLQKYNQARFQSLKNTNDQLRIHLVYFL